MENAKKTIEFQFPNIAKTLFNLYNQYEKHLKTGRYETI